MDDLFQNLSVQLARKVTLMWDETFLVVVPDVKVLHPVLTIDTSTLEETHKEGKRPVRKKVTRLTKLYEEVVVNGTKSMSTHHGFIDLVRSTLQEHGIPYEVLDGRMQDLPPPRFDLMSGFRFSQRALTEQALMQRRSGLIGAPTRFGKSTVLLNTLRAYPTLCAIVTAPNVDLVDQLYDELKAALPDRDVRKLHGASKGKTLSPDITVVSFDSLDHPNIDPSLVHLLLIDEPHAVPTNTRMPRFLRFNRALKYGYGATLEGRFDGRDELIVGIIGPVLAERTYREAVAEGAIAPLTVIGLRIPVRGFDCYDRNAAYKISLWQNESIGQLMHWMLQPGGIIPSAWQVLAFINNEKQLDCLRTAMKDVPMGEAMAKLMTGKQRSSMRARMKSGEERFCAATHIYAQGVTFSDLRMMINLEGGGASTKALQKPGRVAELRPGKKCGVILDFIFYASASEYQRMPRSQCWALTRESTARLKSYEEIGFNVVLVNDYTELMQAVQATYDEPVKEAAWNER